MRPSHILPGSMRAGYSSDANKTLCLNMGGPFLVSMRAQAVCLTFRRGSDEVAELVRERGAPPSSLDGTILGLGLASVAVPLEEGRRAVRGRGHAVGGGHERARVAVKVGVARKLCRSRSRVSG